MSRTGAAHQFHHNMQMNREPILDALDGMLDELALKQGTIEAEEATRAIAKARGKIAVSEDWPWDKPLLEALSWMVKVTPGKTE